MPLRSTSSEWLGAPKALAASTSRLQPTADALAVHSLKRLFREPLRISLHVDHGNRTAELKLRDQLKQERGRGLAFRMNFILLRCRVEREVAVRRHASQIEAGILAAGCQRRS
jgi:hypothetical protein